MIDRIYNALSRHPWLTMAGAVFLQTAFSLNSRALWFSDEVRYANAYENMERAGAWVVLALNGMPYPDKPPVYFWFLSLLDNLTPFDPPAVFFVGAALSGLGFLYATYWLGRVLGLSRDRCLGAALITLSTLFFAAVLHYSRMDLMFAALIVATSACLARTFVRDGASGWAVLGFGLAGLAVLVKGPLGILFPLLALAFYLAWRGKLRRMTSAPVLLGLAVAALVAACWVLAAWIVEGPDFVRTVFVEQIFQRAANTFHHKEGFSYYFAVLPAVWLPWTLFLFGLPLTLLFTRTFWSGLLRGRKTADPARTWLW
ncbi:MAG: glycosyltransferase family 39 protein, partial [Proteobacteria bacterium]|nr:glycosyltransferase family 39 protein [Pseudomonadota bacterium]